MRVTAASLFVLTLMVGSALAAPNDPLAPIGKFDKPPVAPVKPVTETLFGQPVTDDYRYMEALDPATISWMKAQGSYTRSILDSIKPRAALGKRVADFTGSFGFIQGYVVEGGRAFYEERAPGSDNFDLLIKDAKGERKIVDVAALRAAHGGKPYAINFFLASPEGSKVAVGISEGGSEDASLWVYDTVTGKQLAGPVDRAEFGATAWSDDGYWLYFTRLAEPKPGASPGEKYLNSSAVVWDQKHDPRPILGTSVPTAPKMEPQQFPFVLIWPKAPLAAAVNVNGVQNEIEVALAPAQKAPVSGTKWTAFIARDDGVTSMAMRGNEIFLLSHKNAPTFQVLALKDGEPVSKATVLVPASPDRVIEAITTASDGLYVQALKGSYSQLLRIPTGKTTAEEIPLPFKGHVSTLFADPRRSGAAIAIDSWAVPSSELSYDPVKKTFTDLKLGVTPNFDSSKFVVQDLESAAKDGVKVPLSLMQPAGVTGAQITVIEAYGSYGISTLADFSPRRVAAALEGITYGVCHVRGGGELGEAWRLGGKDANKPNTWNDLIACGEDAIARGITSKDKLFIIGGSAGGITMGRAMTERPDLFAGVIAQVPDMNPLRSELMPGGPANIPEFGTFKTEQGFKNLYEMDTIQHIKKGTQYPAVIITTGLNDPRVAPWIPAKSAAAFQASGTVNPVLLRVDAEAGHGIGSTKSQADALTADWIAFVMWRAGAKDWRPDAANLAAR